MLGFSFTFVVNVLEEVQINALEQTKSSRKMWESEQSCS